MVFRNRRSSRDSGYYADAETLLMLKDAFATDHTHACLNGNQNGVCVCELAENFLGVAAGLRSVCTDACRLGGLCREHICASLSKLLCKCHRVQQKRLWFKHPPV